MAAEVKDKHKELVKKLRKLGLLNKLWTDSSAAQAIANSEEEVTYLDSFAINHPGPYTTCQARDRLSIIINDSKGRLITSDKIPYNAQRLLAVFNFYWENRGNDK